MVDRGGVTLVDRRLSVVLDTATLWLLESQSLATFILVKSISMLAINVVAAFATIGLAALVARQEGLMGPARELVPVTA